MQPTDIIKDLKLYKMKSYYSTD